MIQPPFPSTIRAQQRQFTFLTTKTVDRNNQENDVLGQACACAGGGGGCTFLSALHINADQHAHRQTMFPALPKK